jgi:hypothetical protein
VPHLPSCTTRQVKSPIVSRLPQQVIALSEVPRIDTGEFVRQRDVSERAAHAAKPTNAVPFPLISIGGTGTTPPRNQSSRCHPAAVRLNRPARSSDPSASPRRSFLSARQSRNFARVSTMARAKFYSTCSSRLRHVQKPLDDRRRPNRRPSDGISRPRQWQRSILASGSGWFVPAAQGIAPAELGANTRFPGGPVLADRSPSNHYGEPERPGRSGFHAAIGCAASTRSVRADQQRVRHAVSGRRRIRATFRCLSRLTRLESSW